MSNILGENFNEILASKKFIVPRFQRDYSWELKHWRDLWLDITTIEDSREGFHYMGYLVFADLSDNEKQIIDGQQRITTLFIFLISAVNRLKSIGGDDSKENERSAENLFRKYISEYVRGKKEGDPKLKLNRNNDDYFYNHIIKGEPFAVSGQSNSNKRLSDCLNYFTNELKTKFGNDGVAIDSFVNRVLSRLVFTKLTVPDDRLAYKIFETINSRGAALSPADLVKNFLFQKIATKKTNARDIDALDSKWSDALNRVGDDEFSAFLRAFWNH